MLKFKKKKKKKKKKNSSNLLQACVYCLVLLEEKILPKSMRREIW